MGTGLPGYRAGWFIQLRHNLSAHDAVYVALAEVLNTGVLTCHGRLARAPRAARRVELVRPRA
jgi:predicted nucleic acid-binding protein